MRNFLFGILFIYLVQTGLTYYSYEVNFMPAFHTLSLLSGEPLVHIVTGRCTNEIVYFQDGTVKSSFRKYFKCNKLSIAISDLIYKE